MSVELSLIISIVNELEKLIMMMAIQKNTCPQNSIVLLTFEEMASTFLKIHISIQTYWKCCKYELPNKHGVNGQSISSTSKFKTVYTGCQVIVN